MCKKLLMLLLATSGFYLANAQPPSAQPMYSSNPKKVAGITDKVKTSRKMDGLFTLYQDTANGSLQIYVKKNQLGKEFIYQSFSMGGPTSLFLYQNMIRQTMVFKIQKAFDR